MRISFENSDKQSALVSTKNSVVRIGIYLLKDDLLKLKTTLGITVFFCK